MGKRSSYGKKQPITHVTNMGRTSQKICTGNEQGYQRAKASNVQNWSDSQLWQRAARDAALWQLELKREGLC